MTDFRGQIAVAFARRWGAAASLWGLALHRLAWCALCIVALAVVGCNHTTAQSSVLIDSVNYMRDRSVTYSLYDLAQTPPRAIGGANVDSLARGGEKGCCINLPTAWRPNMMVRLVWAEADFDRVYDKKTRDMEVPRYESPADLYVVFYPGDEVELVVSAAEPGHPDWRGRNKKTPWNQCVATYGRKPCKAALPKMFDTKGGQGYCTWAKRENRPNFETHCEFAMQQCMADYEDSTFCNSVLRGPSKE